MLCCRFNRTGNDGNNIFHSGESNVLDFKGESLINVNNSDEFIQTIQLSKSSLENFRKQFAFFQDADEFNIL